MNKTIIAAIMAVIVLYACNNDGAQSAGAAEEKIAAETPKANTLSGNPVYQKGLELIGKSDCLTCHKIEETSTGPAYRDVANKYPNTPATIDTLAHKILKGGSGNWGQVPMAAHPALTEEEAKQLAKYVMLFKNN
jgi:cytochrome c